MVLPDLLNGQIGIGGDEELRGLLVGDEPVLHPWIGDAGEPFAVREDLVEVGPDYRLGEVVDVGVPGAVEDAGEHEPGVVVEDHVACVVQGADLAHRRTGRRVIRPAGERGENLTQRIRMARLDLGKDGELAAHPILHARALGLGRGCTCLRSHHEIPPATDPSEGRQALGDAAPSPSPPILTAPPAVDPKFEEERSRKQRFVCLPESVGQSPEFVEQCPVRPASPRGPRSLRGEVQRHHAERAENACRIP